VTFAPSPGDIRHEPGRFTLTVDGETAFVAYRMVDEGTIDFTTTFVPPALRLRGLGVELVEHALAYAAGRRLRVVSSCWFVQRVLEAGRR
jgi:predicted GNAT family acetyltransferase